MSGRRGELQLQDLSALVAALNSGGEPPRIYQALEDVSARAIGHRLFTIMRFHADTFEVERVHTSMPSVYPVGGRKKKPRTPWGDHVLGALKVFRADDPESIRAAFDDYDTIVSLGLGSILNIPIGFEGRCFGTMNLCHETGWYRPEDEQVGLVLGAFLLPVLFSCPRMPATTDMQ